MANAKHDPRMSVQKIQKILSSQPQQTAVRATPPVVTFGGQNDSCDSLKSEEQIRRFRDFISDVISRYEGNIRLQEEAEREEQDLKHAIELADHLTDKEKRFLFRNLKKALKTRRACKTENEVLQPLYEFVSDRSLYNRLGNIHGVIKGKKDVIVSRQYSCRTSALDGFRGKSAE